MNVARDRLLLGETVQDRDKVKFKGKTKSSKVNATKELHYKVYYHRL